MGWKHKEGKLLKPVLVHRWSTWSCRLSSSCQTHLSCEDSKGLSFHWLLPFLLSGARLGTETWKEMMTEVSLRLFGMAPIFTTPHHQLPSIASVQTCVVVLRRNFCWCWVTPNQDCFPSRGPNVAAGPSVQAQERMGRDQEEEKGQQLI